MSHVHNVTLKLTGSHPRIKKKKKKEKKKSWRPASIFCVVNIVIYGKQMIAILK